MVAITTEALSKVYAAGKTKAVDGLDLEVRTGEIFGLLGPNGAGKTTTVGMLTTRVVPTSGRAIVGGVDIVANPTEAKQLIGVVSQTNTLDRSLSVYENLYFHGRYFGMGARQARSAATESLERFRLAERASAPVVALVGGMAQRLMVARAIMHNPTLLFLDEPTAGLDPQSRIALWEELRRLHADGHTILLTTHYMEEAQALADRVAIMDHGKLLALDTPDALRRSVGADAEVKVAAEGDPRIFAEHLSSLRGATNTTVVDGTVRVALQGEAAPLPSIVAHATAGGFKITELSVDEPTLETVFIKLTGKDLRE